VRRSRSAAVAGTCFSGFTTALEVSSEFVEANSYGPDQGSWNDALREWGYAGANGSS